MEQCKNPERIGARRKTLIVAITSLLLLGLVGISLAVNHKGLLQNYLPWSVQRITKLIDKSSLSIFDLRGCLCAADRNITVRRGDGLRVSGSLYGLKHSETRGGILLLHGNTPLGRNLSLYRIMAKKLAERGYLILTIDFTGFGESDDPFHLEVQGALDRDRDVDASLEYLSSLDELNGEEIYLIGHSMGASPAMRLGAQDPRVAGIIAIGPSRRVATRMADPLDREYWWGRAQKTRRQVYGKPFPVWFTKEKWLERSMRWDIGRYLPLFSQAAHAPLLLIDGELENEKDKLYLQNYSKKLTGNTKHITISGSDHYSNSLGVMGFHIYDLKAMNQTVSEILQWMQGVEEQKHGA